MTKDSKTKSKTKAKPSPKKKAEKEKAEPRWSDRLSYPMTWREPVKKLAAKKDCTSARIYQLALKDFLFKHNLLPSQNHNKS